LQSVLKTTGEQNANAKTAALSLPASVDMDMTGGRLDCNG